MERFADFVDDARRDCPATLSPDAVLNLLRHHGSEFRAVLKYATETPALAAALGESPVIAATVVHAVREEMARRLGDVVFRRTDLGTAGHPGDAALVACARLMGEELGWSEARIERELEGVGEVFP